VFLDGAPTIHCFHASCKEAVEEKNRELRSTIGKAKFKARSMTKEEQLDLLRKTLEAKKEFAKQATFDQRIQHLKRRIFTDYVWSLEQALADSPVKLPENKRDHWHLLLTLFKPDDTIWIGDVTDSGGEYGWTYFKPVKEWLTMYKNTPPGNFTCPSVFFKSATKRSKKTVHYCRYWVVESDMLSKDDCLAIFRWLRAWLPLHAIVDTAGKSLHGWFDVLSLYNRMDREKARTSIFQLKAILTQLGCDPKMFTLSQPCRLPGALRDGKRQHLIWFNHAIHKD
jgi:hypothetical protein